MYKRILILFVTFLITTLSYAQKVIQMENANGVYKIACSVNGAKMKMIFDTGASSVSLSETMANFLYDNGYISKDDILGSGTSRIADGSIVNNVIINIRDIEISGLHIKNVQAIVVSSQNAPLLLGQTAIQQLGKITLNGDKLIINNYEGDYTDAEIEKMTNDAENYYKSERYTASIEYWEKLKDYIDLTTYGYFILTDCCFRTNQLKKCIKYGREWEKMYKNEKPSSYTSSILGVIGVSLRLAEGKIREGLSYLERAIQIDEIIGDNPCFNCYTVVLVYYELGDWDSCIKYSKKAMKGFFAEYDTSAKEIETKGIDNQQIGACLYYYALACKWNKDIGSANYLMKLSARCNYEEAIAYCLKNDIKLNYKQSLFD